MVITMPVRPPMHPAVDALSLCRGRTQQEELGRSHRAIYRIKGGASSDGHERLRTATPGGGNACWYFTTGASR